MSEEKITDNQQNQNKDAIKFESSMKKLIAVLGGSSLFKKTKILNKEMADIIAQITSEEKEETSRRVKEKIKMLIKENAEHDKFVKEKKAEFEKAVIEKKKEFTKKIDTLLSEIENVSQIESEYAQSLVTLAGGSTGQFIDQSSENIREVDDEEKDEEKDDNKETE